jgi:hypothetical protein
MVNPGVAQQSRAVARCAVLALALVAPACIVQGGEERGRETDASWVGVVRFDAVNQDGKAVGAGCTIDSARYYDRIQFSAVPGDRVELTERFEAVATTVGIAEQHGSDPEYWCAQTETRPYDQVLDVRCWRSLEPNASDACALEGALVGTIESAQFVPDIPAPTAGKTDGFTLSISVLGSGKQCIQMSCTDAGIGREQLAFVVH